jgi:hypothetical protein
MIAKLTYTIEASMCRHERKTEDPENFFGSTEGFYASLLSREDGGAGGAIVGTILD